MKEYLYEMFGEDLKILPKWIIAAIILSIVSMVVLEVFKTNLYIQTANHGVSCFFMGMFFQRILIPAFRRVNKED